MRYVEKYGRARQATDYNMTHAHCMLDTYGYKYTHTDCVTFIAFPLEQRLQCYVIRTLPVLS
jgi:hypothetical protein